MIGTMSTYDEKEQAPKVETPAPKKEEIATKPTKNTKSKDTNEDDFFTKK